MKIFEIPFFKNFLFVLPCLVWFISSVKVYPSGVIQSPQKNDKNNGYIVDSLIQSVDGSEYWQLFCSNYFDYAVYFIPGENTNDCFLTPAMVVNNLPQVKKDTNIKDFHCSNIKVSQTITELPLRDHLKYSILNVTTPFKTNTTQESFFRENLIYETECFPGFQMTTMVMLKDNSLKDLVPDLKKHIPIKGEQSFDLSETVRIYTSFVPKYNVKDVTRQINSYTDSVQNFRNITGEVRKKNIRLKADLQDLVVKRVKVLMRNFILDIAMHELLSVCAEGDEGTSYYFIFDRTSSNKQATGETLVKVIYVGYSNNCNSTNTVWPENDKSNEDQGYKYVFLKSDHEITGREYNSTLTMKKGYYLSFDVLLKTVWEYTRTFQTYTLDDKNCQHFSTGFFNTLTGKKEAFYNMNVQDGTKINFKDILDIEEKLRFSKK